MSDNQLKIRLMNSKLLRWGFSITRPWWFTERVFKRYLKHAIPFINGRLLDVGCGCKPYENLFSCDEYIGVDLSSSSNPDIVGDIRDLRELGNESFDSVLSNQVLEHVDEVEKVISEMYRVLKYDGYVCITVPFIGRLHGMPHDYWRFSSSGIRYLLEKYNFSILQLEPMGGFVTTQLCLWHFFIYELCRQSMITRVLLLLPTAIMNLLSILIYRFDFDKSTPSNYIVIAQKVRKVK